MKLLGVISEIVWISPPNDLCKIALLKVTVDRIFSIFPEIKVIYYTYNRINLNTGTRVYIDLKNQNREKSIYITNCIETISLIS